jgi:integrase
LARFLETRFPALQSFSALERHPHVEAWLLELAEARPKRKNGTRRECIRNVGRFFEDIYEWGWAESPGQGIIRRADLPPPEHYLPRPLPPDLDLVLLSELKTEGDRTSLGLILARRTGLRVGELCRLELDCLLEKPGDSYSLRVPLGKLRSERVIPIDREAADLIRILHKGRRVGPPTVDPETGKALHLLFSDGRPGIPRPYRFSRKLKSVARWAGIAENVHPHRLRHTYATELLRLGMSLLGVMKLLGHRTPHMTLRYVEVTDEDLRRDYMKAMTTSEKRYAALSLAQSPSGDALDSPQTFEAAFDQVITRLKAYRLDHAQPRERKALQRFIERLRRAQSDLPKLLR